MSGMETWKYRWPDVVVFLACFFAQVAFVPLWGGVRLDLVLAMAVAVGMRQGPQAGGLTGLVGGLLLDLVRGRFIGALALTHAVVGYLGGVTQAKLFENSLYLPFLFSAAGTVIAELGFWALSAIWGTSLPLPAGMLALIGKEAFWNGLVSPVLYRLVRARLQPQPVGLGGRAL